MAFQWEPAKAIANFRKHGVRFSEAEAVFQDDYAITIPDDVSDPAEVRYLALGLGGKGRPLVVVFCHRGTDIRIISARLANRFERKQYEENR